jgi:hypothetical protein
MARIHTEWSAERTMGSSMARGLGCSGELGRGLGFGRAGEMPSLITGRRLSVELVAERVDFGNRVADEAVEVAGRESTVVVAAGAALQGLPAATGHQSGVGAEVVRFICPAAGTDDRGNCRYHGTILSMCRCPATSAVRSASRVRTVDLCRDVAT